MVGEYEAMKELHEELKKRLQASIVAYGDAGVMLHTFIKEFKYHSQSKLNKLRKQQHILHFCRADHSKDLEIAAKKLGMGVVQLLRMFPEYIIVTERDDGHVHLRGIANDDTKYNMDIISESNRAMQKEKLVLESVIDI
jgi:hypothetical protein